VALPASLQGTEIQSDLLDLKIRGKKTTLGTESTGGSQQYVWNARSHTSQNSYDWANLSEISE
jgi:hypothetical protein